MYVSRAGEKLAHALDYWHINVTGQVCADLGSSTGGFTDCLLQHGAAKVYAVDTGYGVLDWKLRNDSRVVVMERTNALHARLPEKVDFVSIDVGWTPQWLILPAAQKLLKTGGQIVSLLKPHYELKKPYPTLLESKSVAEKFRKTGYEVIRSPILGEKAGNVEYLMRVIY